MAKGFGSQSEFLLKNVNRNARFYMVAFVTPIVGLFFIYAFAVQLYAHKDIMLILLFLLLYIAVLAVIVKLLKYTLSTDTYIMGRNGEDKIRDELEKLPDDYSYYWGIKIKGSNNDVDFIVVGPTGIFAIDAKSYNGYIEYSKGVLSKNGKELGKNIIGQVKQEALAVHNMISEKYKENIYATPVLAFSSFWAKMKFGMKPVDGVYIIQKGWLNKLITERQPFHYPLDRRFVEQEFERLLPKSS